MDTTVGALKVGAQLVMGKYGVDKDNPYPIVWLKGNPNCDFITEKVIDYLCFDAAEETGHYRRVNNAKYPVSNLFSFLNSDQMLRVHRDFKGLLKDVQDEYDFLAELNKSLQKKVAEWNKDEEIQRAVEMTEYCRTHSLCQMSDNEKKAERAFRDSHYKSCKNGSKYLYELTGTGIGTAITIKCPVCGEEKNITDYDCW